MKRALFFNNKKYSFQDSLLKAIFGYMVENEKRDNNDVAQYAISFITNSIVLKEYDDLDYHEFILDYQFRVSNLICNLRHVFGIDVATKFSNEISIFVDENVDIDTTDYFNAVPLSTITKIASKIIHTQDDADKFKCLLSLISLFKCAEADYEQLIENMDDFHKILFINGIGVRKEIIRDKVYLKPLHKDFDSPLNKYIDIHGIVIPPSVRFAIFSPCEDYSYENNDTQLINPELLLNLQQLTGSKFDVSIMIPPVMPPFDIDNASDIIGKWYSVYKGSEPFSMFQFFIMWFKEDGTHNRSIQFVSSPKIPQTENWSPFSYRWSINDSALYIEEPNKRITKDNYQLYEDKLIIDNRIYYRSFEDCLKNL